MKLILSITLLLLLTCFVAENTLGQDFFIYPNKGQSNDQMKQDKFQCYNWAKGQTGFDPMQAPRATSPPPPGVRRRQESPPPLRCGEGEGDSRHRDSLGVWG